MKIIKSTPRPNGKVRLIIELDANEEIKAFKDDQHYRLGYPLQDDVVCGRHLSESTPVEWCVIEQKWVA